MFEIRREARENHPNREKACLYLGNTKIAVCKDNKVQMKSRVSVSDYWLDALRQEWGKIAAEEALRSQTAT